MYLLSVCLYLSLLSLAPLHHWAGSLAPVEGPSEVTEESLRAALYLFQTTPPIAKSPCLKWPHSLRCQGPGRAPFWRVRVPLVSIFLGESTLTFVLLFSQPGLFLDPAQGLPAALDLLGNKGVQLLPPPLPLLSTPAMPESLTQLLPGSSACEALG